MQYSFTEVAAILFDMDGTLVDSTEAVARSWREWAARHRLDPVEVLEVCHGRPARDTIRWFKPEADAQVEYDFVLNEELRDGGVVALPGAALLLRSLAAAGAQWAIVTSADQRLARHRLRLAELPVPEVLVTVDRVRKGKPDPEGYLLAAASLGVAPANCLVVEDTPIGLTAGTAAGMRVLGIGQTFPRAELPCEIAIADWRGAEWRNGQLSLPTVHRRAGS